MTPNPANNMMVPMPSGMAVYARRAGNKTFAWYVIDRPGRSEGMYYAHREHGAGEAKLVMFAEIKHRDSRYITD